MDSKKPTTNRRHFLKTSLGAALGGSLLNSPRVLAATPASRADRQLIKVAGYDYDRVLAIKDGRVGINDAEINFDTKDIYAVSRHAFGPDQKYDVTELGLIPFKRSLNFPVLCWMYSGNHWNPVTSAFPEQPGRLNFLPASSSLPQ